MTDDSAFWAWADSEGHDHQHSYELEDLHTAFDEGARSAAAQPAPGDEAAKLRDTLDRVLGWFTGDGTYRDARATRAQLAHAYRDGGLPVGEDLRRFL